MLTNLQRRALVACYERPGMSVAGLAKTLNVSEGTSWKLTKKLCNRGWLSRVQALARGCGEPHVVFVPRWPMMLTASSGGRFLLKAFAPERRELPDADPWAEHVRQWKDGAL